MALIAEYRTTAQPDRGLCSERWNSVGFLQRRPAVSRPSKVMSKA